MPAPHAAGLTRIDLRTAVARVVRDGAHDELPLAYFSCGRCHAANHTHTRSPTCPASTPPPKASIVPVPPCPRFGSCRPDRPLRAFQWVAPGEPHLTGPGLRLLHLLDLQDVGGSVFGVARGLRMDPVEATPRRPSSRKARSRGPSV